MKDREMELAIKHTVTLGRSGGNNPDQPAEEHPGHPQPTAAKMTEDQAWFGVSIGVDHGDSAAVPHVVCGVTYISLDLQLRPVELKDCNGKVQAYACPKCGNVTSRKTVVLSRRPSMIVECCDPRCSSCRASISTGSGLRCQACQNAYDGDRRDRQYRDGRKVLLASYRTTGLMVYLDEQDRYVNADELPDDSGVRWGFGTSETSFNLQAEEIIEQALSDHHEDAYSEINRPQISELQIQLDAFVNRNPITSYFPDFSTIVIFHPEDMPEEGASNE